MSIFTDIYGYFANFGRKTDQQELTVTEESVRNLKVLPGNTALPTDRNSTLLSDIEMYQSEEFNPQLLKLLGDLAIHHPKISLAISNIKLANTKFHIYFDDSVPARKQRQMRSYLESRMNSWFMGSKEVLVDTLFYQLAVKGCISVDRVIAGNLSGISRMEFINPLTIRWVRNGNEASYLVQINNLNGGLYGTKLGSTYSYIPLQLTDTSLYGVPFLLSVLESIAFEDEMWQSFKSILKKVGIAGLYKVLVTAPDQEDGETVENYTKKVQDYLADTYNAIKRTSANGIVVGLKEQYEVEIENANGNAAGAEQFFKIINLVTYQALKQDPNMMGESYTVSEAFTKVVLKKMAQQYKNFQQRVASFLEQSAVLDLVLGGYSPKSVSIEFEEAMPEDRMLAEQTRAVQIGNLQRLLQDGIISLQQYAQELGYDKPYKEEMPQFTAQRVSNAGFNYSIPKECVDYAGFTDRKQNAFTKSYIQSTEQVYNDFIDDFGKAVNKLLKKEYKSAASLQNSIIDKLQAVAKKSFIGQIKDVSKKHISESYEYFRKDKRIFGTNLMKYDFVPPEPNSGFIDQRVIDYLVGLDVHYFGTIVTDPVLLGRLEDLLRAYYDGDTDISDLVQEVTEQLQSTLQMEQWKITRIINTTMNKVRTNANILYMQQAKVQRYTIIEVNDRLTCPHCKHLNGKEFTVKKAVDNLVREIESDFEDLPPFATTVGVDDFTALSNEDLERLGFNKPPFHPNCRGVLGAIV